jgi:hypothetical protein
MCFDDWADIARGIMAEKPWAWILIIPWLVISGFVVANLFIAVICESLVKLDELEKKNFEGNRERTTMQGASREIEEFRQEETRNEIKDTTVLVTKLQDNIAALTSQQEELMAFLEKFEQRNDN